jgi:glycosyltransferase involved in cell wall biosynthesis
VSIPDIAVVIPSRRGPRLAFALEALAAQTLDKSRYEVVVVRDDESAGTEPLVLPGMTLRTLSTKPTGPTAKRNLGWRATKAPLIAFTDDDCRPEPDWLEALLSAWGGEPGRFLQGETFPDPDEEHLLHGLARSQRVAAPSEWYQCCNMAYPRILLERLGGFDEEFYFGGEDTDLGARAEAAGAEPSWVPRAKVRHAVLSRTLLQAAREAWRWPSLPLVLSRHPHYRRSIYGGVFWNEFHAKLVLAGLGLVVARRSPVLGAVAVAPYLASRVRLTGDARRLARQLAGVPPRAIVDALEVASTARAAVAMREPVV